MKKKHLRITLGLWVATLAMGLLVSGLPRSAHAITMTFDASSGRSESYTENGMTV